MTADVLLCGVFEAGATPLPSTFALPHSITAAEDRGIVCAADRENGRVQCFDLVGNFKQLIQAPQLGPTLYAITYDKYSGRLCIVDFCFTRNCITISRYVLDWYLYVAMVP